MSINGRYEYKYFCTAMQAQVIKSRIQCFMQIDHHVSDSGCYNVRSLYFDDIFNTGYHANENGTEPREKFRIRVYDNDDSCIFLEKKQKVRGITIKDACLLTREQADMLILGKEIECTSDSPLLLNEFLARSKRLKLSPVVIVDYDRIPYTYPLGNVRVTFDQNIASSNQVSKFFDRDIAKRPIMESGRQIMEVKWDNFLPDYVKQTLQTGGLPRTAFSKYYYCRKFSLSSGVLL